jgi:hypothetical protein
MNKIDWQTKTYETVSEYQVPCALNLIDGYHQGAGIKRNAKTKFAFKSAIWPMYKLRNDLLIDGFIEWEAGRLIRKYITPNSVFLEVGCGDMSLRKYVPSNLWYNALDLEIADFHIYRARRSKQKVNFVVASPQTYRLHQILPR